MNNTKLWVSCALLVSMLAVAKDVEADGEIRIMTNGDSVQIPSLTQDTGLLGAEYKDEAHGFYIRPPNGARIIQRSDFTAATERLNFVVDNKQWLGTVQTIYFKPEKFSPEEYLKSTARELDKNFRAPQIIESRTTSVGGKAAAKLAAVVEVVGTQANGKGKQPTLKEVNAVFLRQELAVQIGTNEYLVLSLYGPAEAKADLIRTFNAMAESFKVLDRADVANRRREEIRAGREWLNTLTADSLRMQLVEGLQYFRIKVENKDVGYLQYEERQEEYLTFKGIGLYTEAKMFRNDDTMEILKNHAFWAFSRQTSIPTQIFRYSMWDKQVQDVVAAPVNAKLTDKFAAMWMTEHGDLQFDVSNAIANTEVRDGRYILSVSQNHGNSMHMLTDQSSGNKKQWPITLAPEAPAPLPKILEYFWPRLVDLNTVKKMGFVVFNSDQNLPLDKATLGLRSLSVVGKEKLVIDNNEITAWHLRDELDPNTTQIWVDAKGRLLMMQTGEKAFLIASTKEKILQLYETRLKQFAYRIGQ